MLKFGDDDLLAADAFKRSGGGIEIDCEQIQRVEVLATGPQKERQSRLRIASMTFYNLNLRHKKKQKKMACREPEDERGPGGREKKSRLLRIRPGFFFSSFLRICIDVGPPILVGNRRSLGGGSRNRGVSLRRPQRKHRPSVRCRHQR